MVIPGWRFVVAPGGAWCRVYHSIGPKRLASESEERAGPLSERGAFTRALCTPLCAAASPCPRPRPLRQRRRWSLFLV
jgi:hypothetical protein